MKGPEIIGKITLNLWEMMIELLEKYYLLIINTIVVGAKAVVLVYDITDHKSFEDLSNWIREVHQYTSASNDDRLFVVVGNKARDASPGAS